MSKLDIYEEAALMLHLRDREAAKKFLYQVAYDGTEEILIDHLRGDMTPVELATIKRLFPDEVAQEAAYSIAVTWRKFKAVEILKLISKRKPH